jgi:hypothetical protein
MPIIFDNIFLENIIITSEPTGGIFIGTNEDAELPITFGGNPNLFFAGSLLGEIPTTYQGGGLSIFSSDNDNEDLPTTFA